MLNLSVFNQKFKAYIQLTRFDRPIGIELLLWPTLNAVFCAANLHPSIKNIIVFALGTVFMRAAGCAINDFADRKVDKMVERTKNRPLTSGVISSKEALLVFLFFVLCSAVLLLFLPLKVFYWSLGAIALASVYPFMKRYTHLPQLFLAAAFSWAIPMAYVAAGVNPNEQCWLLFIANVCWTTAYDTQYAMTDRADDVQVGIKSTAILFGRFDVHINIALQTAFLMCLNIALATVLPICMLIFVSVACIALFTYQYLLCKTNIRQNYFAAFLNNRWVGRLVFLGVILVATGWL